MKGLRTAGQGAEGEGEEGGWLAGWLKDLRLSPQVCGGGPQGEPDVLNQVLILQILKPPWAYPLPPAPAQKSTKNA